MEELGHLEWRWVANPNMGPIALSKQQDKQELVDLNRLNAQLTESLKRCRELLADCRSHLVVNSNQPSGIEEDAERRLG
jgi:hypothetical protein